MNLILLNLQSNQQIKLDNDNPLIIGRSNVLGCVDKRVSRTHGKVTCTVDGKIHLVALHSNPCFFNRNGVPPVMQLNKNEEETLNEGDCLGLLPDEFWFQITSEKKPNLNIENRNPNESTSESDCGNKCSTSTLQNNKTSSESLTVEEELNENKNSISFELNTTVSEPNVGLGDNLVGNSSGFGSPEFEKTRKLPLWMYEIQEAKNKKKSPNKRASPSLKKQNNKKPKLFPGTSDIKIKSELSDTCSGENDKEIDINLASTSRIPDISESVETNVKSENESLKESLGGESSLLKKEEGGFQSGGDDSVAGSVLIRPICQYEARCYRKNPQHKLDFCHPGDADFVAYENRPLCPYGAACYRKNEKHKTDYRHPVGDPNLELSPSSCSSRASSPLPPKRRRKTIKREDSDFGDEDEYDLEDPFINDGSSDEYIPSDLNSEEEQEEVNISLNDDD